MYDMEDIELTRREATVIVTFYICVGLVLAVLGISELLGI